MAQAMRAEQPQEAFAVDLTKLGGLAVSRALAYADSKTGGTNQYSAPLAERAGAADYFTYSWLKTVADGLADLEWPVLSAHILPTTDEGDAGITDLVLVTAAESAALDLVCASVANQYERAVHKIGFASRAVKVHVLTKDEAARGHALMGGLYSPALQIWP